MPSERLLLRVRIEIICAYSNGIVWEDFRNVDPDELLTLPHLCKEPAHTSYIR